MASQNDIMRIWSMTRQIRPDIVNMSGCGSGLFGNTR